MKLKKQMRKYGKEMKKGMAVAALSIAAATVAGGLGVSPVWTVEAETAEEVGSVTQDGIKYVLYSDNTCEVEGVETSLEGDVILPDTVTWNGTSYKVTEIGFVAFAECNGLTSIDIPDGVTSIEDGAFKECSSLASVKLPDGVTSIGPDAFWECSSLASIKLPNSVTYIGESVFYGCTNLSEIIIPTGVEIITSDIFDKCTNLKKVTLPYTLKEITDEGTMFYGTNKGLTVYMFGELYEDMYDDMDDLTRLYDGDVADHVKFVDLTEKIFTDKQGVCYDLEYGGVRDKIYAYAVGFTKNCKSKIKIPSKVEQYGSTFIVDGVCDGGDGFTGSNNVTELTLSEGIEYLDLNSVCACKNLKCLSVPKTATKIDCSFREFGGDGYYKNKNTKLSKIKIASGNAKYSADNQGCIFNKKKTVLYCALPGVTSVKIPKTITKIQASTFVDCTKLKKVTIPSSVKTIEKFAFSGCKSLGSITLSKSIKTIGQGAFSGCASLKKITIPNSVTKIEPYTFSDCKNLQSVTLSKNIKVLMPFTFSMCNKLKSVKLPAKLEAIHGGTFNGCKGLKSLTFPKSFKKVIDCDNLCPFLGCNNLKNITFKGPVSKGIDQYTFNGCNKNVVVKVPASHYNKFKKIYKGKATVKKL